MQRVEAALQLAIETDHGWADTTPLSPSDYEDYFRQVRSALPELDKKVIMSIASQAVRHSILYSSHTLMTDFPNAGYF